MVQLRKLKRTSVTDAKRPAGRIRRSKKEAAESRSKEGSRTRRTQPKQPQQLTKRDSAKKSDGGSNGRTPEPKKEGPRKPKLRSVNRIKPRNGAVAEKRRQRLEYLRRSNRSNCEFETFDSEKLRQRTKSRSRKPSVMASLPEVDWDISSLQMTAWQQPESNYSNNNALGALHFYP